MEVHHGAISEQRSSCEPSQTPLGARLLEPLLLESSSNVQASALIAERGKLARRESALNPAEARLVALKSRTALFSPLHVILLSIGGVQRQFFLKRSALT